MKHQLNKVYETSNPDYKIMITKCHFPMEEEDGYTVRVFIKETGTIDPLLSFFNTIPNFDHQLTDEWANEFKEDPIKALVDELKSPIWNKSINFKFGQWLSENGYKHLVTE